MSESSSDQALVDKRYKRTVEERNRVRSGDSNWADEIGLSTRAVTSLARAGFLSVKGVGEFIESGIKIPGLSLKSRAGIKEKYDSFIKNQLQEPKQV